MTTGVTGADESTAILAQVAAEQRSLVEPHLLEQVGAYIANPVE